MLDVELSLIVTKTVVSLRHSSQIRSETPPSVTFSRVGVVGVPKSSCLHVTPPSPLKVLTTGGNSYIKLVGTFSFITDTKETP